MEDDKAAKDKKIRDETRLKLPLILAPDHLTRGPDLVSKMGLARLAPEEQQGTLVEADSREGKGHGLAAGFGLLLRSFSGRGRFPLFQIAGPS